MHMNRHQNVAFQYTRTACQGVSALSVAAACASALRLPYCWPLSMLAASSTWAGSTFSGFDMRG